MRSPRNCGTCSAWQANDNHQTHDGTPQQGWCKAKPPVVFQLMVNQPGSALTRQAPQIVPAYQAAFPPVDSANWCCEWRTDSIGTENVTNTLTFLHKDAS